VKTNRANTQYYSIEDKEQLVLSLRHQQRALNAEIEERISMVEAYGHELTQNTRAGSRPKITFYEGLSGLQKVYEDTLTSKTGLKSWGSYDANKIALPSYFRTYYMRRAKKGVAMKSIHPDTPLSREHQARDGQELRESALVPQDRLNFTPEIQIYGDKINIVSWKEKLGIIIQSAEIADAMNSIFEFCFDAAKKYGRATKLKGKKGRK
jgi:hypothetical protein